MSHKDLVIINNEKISKKENHFYCDNIDIKTIPEGLKKSFNVKLVARKSIKRRFQKINIEKISTSLNIFSFLCSIFNTFKNDGTKYLIISITPYTFFSYLLLFIFRKKVFLYLRSNGYEEYKAILGFFGPAIYHIMFKTVTFNSKIITCQERLFQKEKSKIVFPSELNSLWLENLKISPLDKPRLLYVGRIKIEKGIYSLLKILNEIDMDFEFSIVGDNIEKLSKEVIQNKKIKLYSFQTDNNILIDFYDKNNIFILPSFTEAHPKVLDESLARSRPVIIFKEIEHIIQNKKGIFVSNRDKNSLIEKVNFIMNNYQQIQKDIKKNILPTKSEFISQIADILNSS